MKPNPVEVGARIRNIRLYKGLTTEEFANVFSPSASKGTVSKWENGKYLPNNKRLGIIAAIAGITLEELLYGKKYKLAEFNTDELLDEIKRRLSQ